MQLLCHGAALLDLLLEPYFIYLILRCSPPAMSTYRWYLLAISFSNLILTVDYAVIWSPIVDTQGFDLCLPSSHLDDLYVHFLFVVFAVALSAQWQILLISLAYAVTVICWPLQARLFRSTKFPIFLIPFVCLPSAIICPMIYILFTNNVCMNLSPRPASYPLIVTFTTYALCYIIVSLYLLRKLGKSIRERTSSTSTQSVTLVKIVRRNYLSLMVIMIASDIAPTFLILGGFAFIRADFFRALMIFTVRYTSISACSYSWVATVVTIVFTTPYRTKTLQVLRSISALLPR
uniref:G_PROTEIN_RECEP_F1_2 domain-containing protein n=1 Tax=Steinernema glaseri TaxID=37863 RepID=A0A1I7ZC20_9BILA